jgi:Fimbrial assembly protein (PilN)
LRVITTANDMKRIDLIPESRRLARQRRVRCRAWFAIGGAYASLLVLVCLSVFGVGMGMDMRDAVEDLAQLDSELAELQKTREQLRPELADRRMILLSSRSIADQPDWSVLLAYLADDLLDDEIVLRACSLAPADGSGDKGELADSPLTLTLNGYAKSTPAASLFVLRLEQSGLFDRVILTRTNLEPFLEGQAIAFEVRCLVGETKGAIQ